MPSASSAPSSSSLLKESPTEKREGDTRRIRQITTLSACLLSVAFLAALALGVAYHPGPPKPPASVAMTIPPTIVTNEVKGGRRNKFGKERGRADAPMWADNPTKSQSRGPKPAKPGKKWERKRRVRPLEKIKEVEGLKKTSHEAHR